MAIKFLSAVLKVKKGSLAQNPDLQEEIRCVVKASTQAEARQLIEDVEFPFLAPGVDMSHYTGPKIGQSSESALVDYIAAKERIGQENINIDSDNQQCATEVVDLAVIDAISSSDDYINVCDPEDPQYFIEYVTGNILKVCADNNIIVSNEKLVNAINNMPKLMPLMRPERVLSILNECVASEDPQDTESEGQLSNESPAMHVVNYLLNKFNENEYSTEQIDEMKDKLEAVLEEVQEHCDSDSSRYGYATKDHMIDYIKNANYQRSIGSTFLNLRAIRNVAQSYQQELGLIDLIDIRSEMDSEDFPFECGYFDALSALYVAFGAKQSYTKKELKLVWMWLDNDKTVSVDIDENKRELVFEVANYYNQANNTANNKIIIDEVFDLTKLALEGEIIKNDKSITDEHEPPVTGIAADNCDDIERVVYIEPVKNFLAWVFVSKVFPPGVNGEYFKAKCGVFLNGLSADKELDFSYNSKGNAHTNAWGHAINLINEHAAANPWDKPSSDKLIKSIGNRSEKTNVFCSLAELAESLDNRCIEAESHRSEFNAMGERLGFEEESGIGDFEDDVSMAEKSLGLKSDAGYVQYADTEMMRKELAELDEQKAASFEGAKQEVAEIVPEKAAALPPKDDLKTEAYAEVVNKTEKLPENLPELTSHGDEITRQVDELNERLLTLKPGESFYLDDVANDVYHKSLGYSSSNIKDELISSKYRHAKDTGDIEREVKKCFNFGNYSHTVFLQPHLVNEEYCFQRELPEGTLTGSSSLKAAIDKENSNREPLANNDELKIMIDDYNTTLPDLLLLSGSVSELEVIYDDLPAEFQGIGDDEKRTGSLFKKFIKNYNDTLPGKLKSSGGRDNLLTEISKFNPDFIVNEKLKKPTLPTTGTKKDLAERVRSFNPSAIFEHELIAEWEAEQENGLIPVSLSEHEQGERLKTAVYNDPIVSNWVKANGSHVCCERSYFWCDELTGLILKARTDKEIGDYVLDLKTIEVRQDIKKTEIEEYLNREIEKRGYHISAAHYLNGTNKSRFFWLFINKMKGYEWAIIYEASADHLELGQYEVLSGIESIYETTTAGVYPGPISHPVNERGIAQPINSTISHFAQKKLNAYRSAGE